MSNEINISERKLATQIADLINEARKTVVTAVNVTMVYTYYEIGRLIVEDEQNGNQRAEYGKGVLKNISAYLTPKFGKGFSVENLDRMRFFYKTYSAYCTENKPVEKSSTVLTKSGTTPHFTLSWSHYLKLMRIENADERRFYEIEATQNSQARTICGN